MRSSLGTPIKVRAVHRQADSPWLDQWEVVVEEDGTYVHSTTHRTLDDALTMVRILALGQEEDDQSRGR